MPRAYTVDNAVLVIGNKDAAIQATYGLLLNPAFDPKKAVIVTGKDTVNSYNIEELKKFKILFLVEGSVDQQSATILAQYKDAGGILLPDITADKIGVTQEDIDIIFTPLQENMKELKITDYTPNGMSVEAQGKAKFLVVSEKMAIIPGWHAVQDDKEKQIYRADGVISTFYLENENNVFDFYYKPKSFVIGSWITILTLIVFLGLIAYSIVVVKRETIKSNNE